MRTSPPEYVGVFDSGVGGLSVLRALWERLPNEHFYYVADSANCPYSERSVSEIQALSLAIAEHLRGAGAKAIVVACNTASASALPALRERMRARDGGDLPIVGMVPALKTAVGITRRGAVGVLATPATISGYLYQEVQKRYAAGVQVISQTCPGLVERIEAGDLDGPETEALLRACLAPMLAAKVDVLVLGCTHYPFVAPLLRRILGPEVELLEPSGAVAWQTQRVLTEAGLAAKTAGPQEHPTEFATTGNPEAFQRSLERLLGVRAPVVSLAWEQGRLLRAERSAIR